MSASSRRRLRVPAATAAALLLGAAVPAAAYVGPGAGFAFLSSFLVLFLTFALAVVSFVAWPFRFVWRLIRRRGSFKGASADRVVVLGLDGMEPSLAEKFMAEGKLPNLARLRKEGFYGKLRTTTPAISPVAWSSFMTGCEPSKHNIFDFLSRDPRTHLPDLSSARIGKPRRTLRVGKYEIPLSKPEIRGMRKSVSFWKILGDRGIHSTVLRVPITFPPEKFKGHMLSGMCAPDLKGSQGTFAFYSSDPAKAVKREGGVVIPVAVEDGGVVRTSLSGPENTMVKDGGEVRLPMTVTLSPDGRGATVAVGRDRIALETGRFSPWTRVTFKPGLGIKVHAICRFLLTGTTPHFEMYVTPLNIDPEKPALPISTPFYYSVYLSKLLGRFITLGEANDTWALNEGVLDESAFLDLTYSNHMEWEGMLFNAVKKVKKGLTAIVFETTDSIQHMFFRYLDPGHPALRDGRSRLSAKVIEDLYVRMDGLVGRVRAALGPRDALFVMSDHGFKSFRRGVNLNAWLLRNGYLALKDGTDGGGEWFRDVDWTRTRAYGLGLGGVYLNLKGRETDGTVAPGEEARALKDELIARLSGYKDPDTGAVAILRAYDRDAIYHGPYRENAPDLIIGYNEGYRASWDGVTGKAAGAVVEDNVKAWSGDHCIDPGCVPGVLFSSLRLGEPRPSIMDVAPTVLRLFGVTPPAHMDGRSLLPDGATTPAPDLPEMPGPASEAARPARPSPGPARARGRNRDRGKGKTR